MAIEIERKFLVDMSKLDLKDIPSTKIIQGYLSISPAVRVITAGEKAYITIKGEQKGISVPEFEYEIPMWDALKLIIMCKHTISKNRYYIQTGKHTWEVDVFNELNAGLVIAEIELDSEDEEIDKPEWIGEEVTMDFKYKNTSLSMFPYDCW